MLSGSHIIYISLAFSSLILQHGYAETPPTVVIQQVEYLVSTGNSVILNCSIISTTLVVNIYWQRTVSGTITNITSTTNNSKYSGSTTASPSLTIMYADQNDAGQYTCFATNAIGTGQSSATTLRVTGIPPIVQIERPEYNVTTGSNVTLSCSVSLSVSDGSNISSIFWQRNVSGTIRTITSTTNISKYIGSTTNIPSLTIIGTGQNDAGQYRCFASNSEGTGRSLPTTLTVAAPPGVVILHMAYYATTGTNVSLTCILISKLPIIKVYWQQKNVFGTITNITSTTNTSKYSGSTTNNPSLTILDAAQSDAGQYTCLAANSAGTGQSSSSMLNVTNVTVTAPTFKIRQTAYFVTIGNNVTLTCLVFSILPITRIYWERNVMDILTNITSATMSNKYLGSTTNSPSLTIIDAAQSDAGIYTCFAANSIGTVQSSAMMLIVTGSDNVYDNVPSVTIGANRYFVTAGNSIRLDCTLASIYVVSVYWMINGSEEIKFVNSSTDISKYGGSTVNDPSLVILNATPNDEGLYTCFAVNDVGTGNSPSTRLTVYAQNTTNEERMINLHIIVGILGAALVVLIILSIVIFCYQKGNRKKNDLPNRQKSGNQESQNENQGITRTKSRQSERGHYNELDRLTRDHEMHIYSTTQESSDQYETISAQPQYLDVL